MVFFFAFLGDAFTTPTSAPLSTPVETKSDGHSMVIEAEKHILASLYNDHSSRMASIEVEFENGEPSEGYLRLMNELYKLI